VPPAPAPPPRRRTTAGPTSPHRSPRTAALVPPLSAASPSGAAALWRCVRARPLLPRGRGRRPRRTALLRATPPDRHDTGRSDGVVPDQGCERPRRPRGGPAARSLLPGGPGHRLTPLNPHCTRRSDGVVPDQGCERPRGGRARDEARATRPHARRRRGAGQTDTAPPARSCPVHPASAAHGGWGHDVAAASLARFAAASASAFSAARRSSRFRPGTQPPSTSLIW
jgi:hypothetical protein